MADPRIERMADLVVNYCVEVKEGDTVAIGGGSLAAPLLNELQRAALRAGGHPSVQVSLPGSSEIFLKTANDAQLTRTNPLDRLVIEEFDCLIQVMSQHNTREMMGIDPARQAKRQESQRDLTETYMRRSADGSLRWNICLYPTPAYAQDADMSVSDFEEFVYSACKVDTEDPVRAWQEATARQERLVEFLEGMREVQVVGPDTDLRLSIAGRRFINDDGKKNLPGGEVFTSPVEDSAEGTVRFSFPASIGGRLIEDVRLRFAAGRVVELSARTNEDYLRQMIELDDGASLLGEFALGTNANIQRFTKNILFDEKIGGTMHLALGAGFTEIGGRNQSALHMDMVCDLRAGSEVRVDGELLAKDGEFVV